MKIDMNQDAREAVTIAAIATALVLIVMSIGTCSQEIGRQTSVERASLNDSNARIEVAKYNALGGIKPQSP